MEIKCQDCGQFFSDKNNACPHCSGNQQPALKRPLENAKSKKCRSCAMAITEKAKVCPYCRKSQGISPKVAFVIIAIFTIFIIMAFLNAPSYRSIGQDAVLNSGGDLVPVAINEAAFNDWTKARVAKDKTGMTFLLASGRIFSVDTGTKVRVIDQAYLIRKIRILSGEKEGASGWVSADYLK